MARMRTLKPEFWDSPSTAEADLAVRLTFMAMWNWADDSGHGTANLKELEAFVFPNDEVAELPRRGAGNSGATAGGWRNFAEICGEVADVYGVVFYSVNGRPYFWIPSFKSHQAKDFRATSRYPTVEEGEIVDITGQNGRSRSTGGRAESGSGGNSAHAAGDSATRAGNYPLVIGEQGKRVIGEEGNSGYAIASRRPDLDALFESAYSHWPVKKSKEPARKKFKQLCKRIDPDALAADIRRFGEAYAATTAKQFIPHLSTWLNQERWTDDLPQRQVAETQPRPAEVGASLIAHYSDEPSQGELTWQ